MRASSRVNVLFVAMVAAIVHAAASVVFMPFFSTLLLSFSGPTLHHAADDMGMLLGVITPLAYGGIGFGLGALMAFSYNMFVWALAPTHVSRQVVVQPQEEVVAPEAIGTAA